MSASSLLIQNFPPGAEEDWEALVKVSPTANRFQHLDCLQMLEETDSYHTRFLRLGVYNAKGSLRAAWALPYRAHLGLRYSTYFEFYYAGPMLHPDLETGSVHVAKERLDILHLLAQTFSERLHVIEAESHPRLNDLRGLQYAGWTLRALYTHVWEFNDPDVVFAAMNRERRRLIRRAGEHYTFAPLHGNDSSDAFIHLYRELVKKFDWTPLPRWDHDLKQRLAWLRDRDAGLVYGARDEEGRLCAAVILLLSREDRTVYLWRCGYIPDQNAHTVIPALYWNACLHIRDQWNLPFTANFGGSPRRTLSHFKDYLGAKPVLHFKLIRDRPGPPAATWRALRRGKETARRLLTRRGLLGGAPTPP